MSEPLIQKSQATVDPFRRMADRIEKNADATFGGAVVIVPPSYAGDTIELLMLDAQGDAAQFWGTIATRIQIILKSLDDQRRGFPR